MKLKSWNRHNYQELLTMVLMNYQILLNDLCSRIVDHRNCQIDYLFTRILNLIFKNYSNAKINLSVKVLFLFLFIVKKYFGLNQIL